MSFGILNALMLLGLAGVVIPPLIHLLNRRRYEVVDWGAMQFLQVSETTRRRLLIEEILLMLLRMGLIAIMVLALTAPFLISSFLSSVGSRPERDIVLVIDGSYSMGYTGSDKSPHEQAKEWAKEYLGELAAGDSVAILQAKQKTVHVLEPTHDLEKARQTLDKLPEPRGGADWPAAVQAAEEILQKSRRPLREIILLGDGQRHGWSDNASLLHWEFLGSRLKQEAALGPKIYAVNLTPERKKDPPNWLLAPIESSRAVASAGKTVRFRSAIVLAGQESYQPPYRIRLEVDGQPQEDIKFPDAARAEKGRVPFDFSHKFNTPGSHLVSVILEPDPPRGQREAGYQAKDEIPGDNRQDLVVEVLEALPVLLVDGDDRPESELRGADFLHTALAPARERPPAMVAKTVSIKDFTGKQLAEDLAGPGTRPRVLMLCDVPRLTTEQAQAVDDFIKAGGGVLVTLGERAEADFYNSQLYREGQGWLPASLQEKTGEITEEKKATQPLLRSFFHPALELFREPGEGALSDARFPRWWKLATTGKHSPSMTVALLTSGDPLLVERAYGQGRVLMTAVPLDNTWRIHLTGLKAYLPMARELAYYLAGARGTQHNLDAQQPLVYRPEREDVPPAPVKLQPPEGEAKELPVEAWPFRYEDTRETGVYRLTPSGEKLVYYAVKPDGRESNLTAATTEELDRVAELVPITYETDRETILGAAVASFKREIWWWLMLAVVFLLLGEVWLTRRIVKNRI
ncbi:MAG: VWA domain-containing protein [Gemmataceae bacterium]